MFTDRKLSHSETRIRHCRPVSRVGDVSDTDTPGIRPGYVSAACPRIPGYVGRKLKNGDVSAQSIRPSSPVASLHHSFLSLVTYSRVPTSRSRLCLTHGQKGRTASAVPRLPLLLAPPSSSPSPFASRRRPPPRHPSPRLASPFASQIDAAAPASPFASQIGPPPRPPTQAPPRAAVLLAASSPFDSQIGAAKAATLLGRPRSEADDLLKTRRPLPAVVLLPPSCSSSLSSSRRLHPRAGSSPPPRPGQRPARTGRGAPRRPRFASTQPPPTKPALDSCPLLR